MLVCPAAVLAARAEHGAQAAGVERREDVGGAGGAVRDVPDGAYALFTFATGEHDAWPELASEAWAQLDGRVSTLETPKEESRWTRLASHVASIHGPMHFREPLVKEDEMSPT